MDITMMSPNSSSASPFMPPVTHSEEKVRKYSKPPLELPQFVRTVQKSPYVGNI